MTEKVTRVEIESAKQEHMKLRFRRALGENVNSNLITNARKAIAKAVIENSAKGRGGNA